MNRETSVLCCELFLHVLRLLLRQPRREHNDKIGDGRSFQKLYNGWAQKAMVDWSDYAELIFNEGVSGDEKVKSGKPKNAQNMVELEYDDDDLPIIPDSDEETTTTIAMEKAMVRQMMTEHYSAWVITLCEYV